jgi:transposase
LDAVTQTHPGKIIEVWFEDEARFGQQGTLTWVWARRGSRPRAIRQTRYDWLYVIGAVCPTTGQSVGLLAPHINTDIINIFLAQMAAEVSPDVHVVLLWDQAGFHSSNNLRIPSNITIVPLPPYSPELNPDESVWNELKNNAIGRMAITGPDDLKRKVIGYLRHMQRFPVLICSFFQSPTTRYAAAV